MRPSGEEGCALKLIVRSAYLEEMASLALTPDIKVITGVRRSGKSKLMEAFSERLKQADAGANIIHINFNLTEFEGLLEYHALEQYIEARYQPGKNNYVLIDEVQMCPSFEKAINSLHAKEKYDIWVTGSNAFLQSSDLATPTWPRSLWEGPMRCMSSPSPSANTSPIIRPKTCTEA